MIERVMRVASSFREAERMVEAEFTTKPLYVIGREALIANKRAAARDKDLLDVALLERSPRARKSGKGRMRGK